MKKIIKAHKIELYPTEAQALYLWRACGSARWAFNWGLGMFNRAREKGAKTSVGRLRKAFNKVKPDFFYEVTCWVYQGAFKDLEAAINRYFDQKKKGNLKPPKGFKPRKDGKPFGWPRFKSRRHSVPSFYIANSSLKLKGKWLQFDKQRCGEIKMAEMLRFEGKIMGARIRHEGGRWWISIQVECNEELPTPPEKPETVIGVDLGVRYLATTNRPINIDGKLSNEIKNPKPLIAALRKLRQLQRRLDRQRRANNPDNYNEDGTVVKGPKTWVSSNRQRATEEQITAVYFRIKSIRANASHKLTKALATQSDAIVIENLNVKGMLKNCKLAKHIADAGFYEKRRQIEYKARWYGSHVHVVDQWYPSSKTCSGCGWIKTNLKSETRWTCLNCGQVNKRDQNAAENLAAVGREIFGV